MGGLTSRKVREGVYRLEKSIAELPKLECGLCRHGRQEWEIGSEKNGLRSLQRDASCR